MHVRMEVFGNSTTFQTQVSQQLGLDLLHIEAAHSILTACSCPHGICRANREVSKAFALVVASAIWTSE